MTQVRWADFPYHWQIRLKSIVWFW